MRLWDDRSPAPFVGNLKGHSDVVRKLKFDKTNSNNLISGAADGALNLWDVRNMSIIHTFNPFDELFPEFSSEYSKHMVSSSVFSFVQNENVIHTILQLPRSINVNTIVKPNTPVLSSPSTNNLTSIIVKTDIISKESCLVAGSNQSLTCVYNFNIFFNYLDYKTRKLFDCWFPRIFYVFFKC